MHPESETVVVLLYHFSGEEPSFSSHPENPRTTSSRLWRRSLRRAGRKAESRVGGRSPSDALRPDLGRASGARGVSETLSVVVSLCVCVCLCVCVFVCVCHWISHTLWSLVPIAQYMYSSTRRGTTRSERGTKQKEQALRIWAVPFTILRVVSSAICRQSQTSFCALALSDSRYM